MVELVDLPCFGRKTRLVWRKHRWCCPEGSCPVGSWTEEVPAIAAARLATTDRAGRWATEQTGRYGRTVNDVAEDLGADWHTANDAVVAYGTPLVDDANRIGTVTALGRVRCCSPAGGSGESRRGPRRSSTSGPASCSTWSRAAPPPARAIGSLTGRNSGVMRSCGLCWTCRGRGGWRSRRCWPTPRRSPIRSGSSSWRTSASSEVRRRVQNDTLGHRGRKDDPLYRCRRLLTKADERLTDGGRAKLLGLLQAGDPHGEVRMAWHAKEVVRSIYAIDDPSPRCGVRGAPQRRSPRRRLPDRDPPTRPHHRPLGSPDRGLAPRTRLERADRSREQSDQTRQTHRVRVPQLRQLPHPVASLRRPTQLDAPGHHHTPLISEAPLKALARASALERAASRASSKISASRNSASAARAKSASTSRIVRRG